MDRPTCKSCQHWNTAIVSRGGICRAAAAFGTLRKIPVFAEGDEFFGSREESYASVHTGPDFGCIHHEPNPQPGTGEP